MSLTPPYSLLTRTSKGSQLTIEELDGNLLFLASTLSGSNTITGSVNFTGSLVDFLQVGTVTGSFSGDGSGLTGVTATVPAGTISSSLQFGNTDDVTFRNITASGDISASGLFSATSGSFDLVQLDDDGKIQLGTDNDFEIFHNGSDAYLRNNGAGNFYIEDRDYSGDIYIRPQPSQEGIVLFNGSSVNLYFAGSLRASTNTNGFQVEGGLISTHVTASGNISASGTITAPSFTGAGTGTVVNITGDVSASGFVSASNIHATGNITAVSMSGDGSGLTGITATLPAGVVSSSLQFTGTDDVTFRNITASGDISIDNPGKLWLDGGSDTYIWASGNNHVGIVAFNNQTLTVDNNSIEVDGYITGSDFIQIAGTANHTGVKISASNSAGDTRDAQMIVPLHGFEIKNSSNNNVLKIYDSQVGINVSAVSSGDYALQVSGSSGGTKAIEAIGDISSSGNITAVSMSGDGSGLTGVSSAVPAGTVSSSLQFGNTDDVTFRNITASANISSSGTITAGFYNIGNQAALIPTEDTLAIADETGGALGLLYTKTTNVTIGTSTALNGAALGVNGNINTNSHITASGNISSSGTVIAGNLNIDATNASSSLSVGVEEKIDVLSGLAITSSAIVNRAYPLGNAGRVTQVIGDTTLDLGAAAYPVDGHHLFYQSGSRECWNATGEFDLSGFGMKRTVGHQIQYGDGNVVGNAFTFNDYRLVVGEYVNDTFGGAFLVGRQSGSTYGANTQYAGFFASSSALGNPGAPHDVDKAFTIFTGAQTGPAFSIYDVESPDNVHNNDPVFSIAANGALGNVTASNISSSGAIYGNILTAAQIGITQVGMLTGLAVNGITTLSGNVTQSGNISSSGDLIGDNLQVETRTMPINHIGGGAGARSGDIINIGNSTTVPGLIYALTGSSYEYVAAQSGSGALASGSLAVAIGTNSNTDGMLMRGFVNLGHDPGGHIGAAVYLTANGSASYLAPTATGDVVRVLGHNFGNNSIYFNPSNDWIVRT